MTLLQEKYINYTHVFLKRNTLILVNKFRLGNRFPKIYVKSPLFSLWQSFTLNLLNLLIRAKK
jgi:hypothetical protein